MSGRKLQKKEILLGNGRGGVGQQRAKSRSGHNCRTTARSLANQIDTNEALQKKRELSNVRRLEAIQKRKEIIGRPKPLIQLDVPHATQHIVFNSSDEDTPELELSSDSVSTPCLAAADEHGEKGTIRRALFDSDDSEDSDNPEAFTVKRQFEGRAGERLFKLQKRIGKDIRFRLDKRFAETVESGESEESDGEAKGEIVPDKLAEQLKQEKSKALSIIDSILGNSYSMEWNVSNGVARSFPSAVLLPHYDPGSSNCAELERPTADEWKPSDDKMEAFSGPTEEDGDKRGGGESRIDSSAPAVSGERYFSVSGDLKDMFSGSCSEHGFSFLGEDRDEDSEQRNGAGSEDGRVADTEASEKVAVKLKPECSEAEDRDHSKTVKPPKLLFFFHSTNENLLNRLHENTFYRTTSLEELEVGWGRRRAAMKQSVRRGHRDAVRMAHKRRKL